MPIYEYRCERGHTFEVMQRMTDDPVASCSTCEAPVQDSSKDKKGSSSEGKGSSATSREAS